LETQDPSKTKTTEEIQNLVIEQTSKQNTIDNLKRKEKFKESSTQEPSEDNIPLTATDTNTSTNKPKIKKEPTKRKMEIINLDDEQDDFMADVQPPKKVTKIKSEPTTEPVQPKKRELTKLDEFVTPIAPASKKSRQTKVKEDPSSVSKSNLDNLLDDSSQSHESQSSKSVQTFKWGAKKKS